MCCIIFSIFFFFLEQIVIIVCAKMPLAWFLFYICVCYILQKVLLQVLLFPPTDQNMHIKVIGNSKLLLGVR